MTSEDTPFRLPPDGWYMIEAKGDHLNSRANVIQVIDDAALKSIVDNFNKEKSKPGFAGMLVDRDHLKHNLEEETRAYAWVTDLEARPDGLWAKVRWTATGKAAVEGGDYRFWSTEYSGDDLQILDNKTPKRVRPLRLDGLTVTNQPNNQGQRPITNRNSMNSDTSNPIQLSGDAHDATDEADSITGHEAAAVAHRKAEKAQREAGHTATADLHAQMAKTHDSTAEAMRNAAANPDPQNRLGLVANSQTKAADVTQERSAAIARYQAAHPKFSFGKCWSDCQKMLPHLFGMPPRGTPPEVANRAKPISSEQEKERDKLAAQIRSKNPGMTFARSWDLCRRDRPDLFGIS